MADIVVADNEVGNNRNQNAEDNLPRRIDGTVFFPGN